VCHLEASSVIPEFSGRRRLPLSRDSKGSSGCDRGAVSVHFPDSWSATGIIRFLASFIKVDGVRQIMVDR
jgi:hypothetical protein